MIATFVTTRDIVVCIVTKSFVVMCIQLYYCKVSDKYVAIYLAV